jgi:Laminin G domain
MFTVRAIVLASSVGAALALAPAAFAVTPGNSWRMDLSGGVVRDANGTQSMTFTGLGVLSASGLVGGAVEFTRAPSLGMAANSRYDNPGTQNFAMGIVFTSQPIPNTSSYSGNLMQKGLFGDPGQVKLQLVPQAQGTVNCRVKGTSGAKIITSSVNVDNGAWHTAVCWRAGNVVGVTVDGVVTSLAWNPGSISNTKDLTLGNKTAKAESSDQHFGRTDFATWVIDPNARSLVEQQVIASG